MDEPDQVSTLLKHLWTSSVRDYRNERLRIQLAMALIIIDYIFGYHRKGWRYRGIRELFSIYRQFFCQPKQPSILEPCLDERTNSFAFT